MRSRLEERAFPAVVPLVLAVLAIGASASTATAQSSPGYRIDGSVFNLGGRPESGHVAASTAYKVTLDSLGEPATATLTSGLFQATGGLPAAWPPPGEVLGLAFDSPTHLFWNPERSAGAYQVYRAPSGTFPASYGSCLVGHLGVTEKDEVEVPPVGAAFLYHVTVSNRLGEEGTLGRTSAGALRPNLSPCP